uniref:Ankyrin repeat-containing protein n=1 Tax=Borely moumouvirus TaxID=2712067 RepID=A0A6G6AB86_9VIRU
MSINELDPHFIFQKNYEYIKSVLDKGYDPNNKLYGDPPIMFAMNNKENIKIINLLLEYGADINQYDDKGWTPLMLSIFNMKIDVIKFLLEKGANTNKSDNHLSCLFLTFYNITFHNWNLDILELLLNHGMNPNYDIFSTFNLVICDNIKEIIMLLISYGLNTRIKFNGKNVLDLIKENKWFESTKLLETQELLNENFTKIFNKIPLKSNKINYRPTSIRTQILLLRLDMRIGNDFDHLKIKYANLFDYFGIYDFDSMCSKFSDCFKYI